MLSDDERKLLQILWNQHRNGRTRLNLAQLCRLSGRNPGRVKMAIRKLAEAGYIEARPGELRVVQLSEPLSPPAPRYMWME